MKRISIPILFYVLMFVSVVNNIILAQILLEGLSSEVEQEWVAIYNGPANLSDEATDIAVDAAGNVYVTGGSRGAPDNYDYATIKYDRNGQMQWIRRYDAGLRDYAYALAIDDSANVYVTGSSEAAGSGEDYLTIKYNTDGVEQWVRRYNGPGNGYDRAVDIAVDNMGNVYVTGTSFGSGTERDFATIKYSPEGNELWVRRYNGAENSVDEVVALALDNSGNVIVTGKSIGLNNRFNYATIIYSSDGIEQWVRRYSSAGNRSDVPYAIAVDGAGNVFVTGSGGSDDSTIYTSDFLTIKYDLSGNQQWIAKYDGPGNDSDIARAIAVDDSGNVYITGISVGEGWWYDIATIKYDSSGIEQWVSRFNSGFVYDLALDQSGNVYVTGVSSDSTTIGAFTTIKYDTYGVQQWFIRYNGPGGYDVAKAITLDESANIYVTGNTDVPGGIPTFDYVTIKYKQKIIPVELISFTASINNNSVILTWQTATETNNRGFEIQRLQDYKIERIQDWKKIGFIEGYGTTTEPKLYSFIDDKVAAGIYCYRLKQIDFDGTYEYFPDANGIEVDFNVPLLFVLEQNFPNPFNPSTTINYALPYQSSVEIVIYDIMGREIRSFNITSQPAGYQGIIWDGRNENGNLVSSGVYLYRFIAKSLENNESFMKTAKLMMLK